uniref:Dolichyl-diphosphooligosaccharide--protein glycotransferase n=1 Tax=Schistocephalus solidus TaxID=70667 RepID=A0A183TH44_SCHSO
LLHPPYTLHLPHFLPPPPTQTLPGPLTFAPPLVVAIVSTFLIALSFKSFNIAFTFCIVGLGGGRVLW